MKPIFLIGYMASGKTTLGRSLARHLNLQFIDLDFYITQRFHKSIPEIFAQRGEEGFRTIEANMLREVGELQDVVISCGGGTPCSESNIEYINKAGISVFLNCSVGCIHRRLLKSVTPRPLVQRIPPEELPEYISGHLASRLEYYTRAQFTIDASHLESKSQIQSTIDSLRRMLGV
ncbi:MAG: shikimate kinase [Prevotella sp.]|nr:shikimate kinase [Bacteroides sp.]MCM1365716.1 shikimate kinase [Prevotella sp.]MCM1436386.1 shikimate kinase [Prevotella sp.]